MTEEERGKLRREVEARASLFVKMDCAICDTESEFDLDLTWPTRLTLDEALDRITQEVWDAGWRNRVSDRFEVEGYMCPDHAEEDGEEDE